MPGFDLPEVQTRLQSAPDGQVTHPESGTIRDLYDCLAVPLTSEGPMIRLLVATHPAGDHKPAVGVRRKETVYELFYTTLPLHAFTASDVLHLYLHRGSFETVLSDEDQEQDADRWVSRTPCGQDCWQVISQWVRNPRLELGQQLRVCTERGQSGSGVSEPGDHQSGHSQVEKSLTAGVRSLKIAREPTIVRDPGVGALDDPSSGQHMEAFGDNLVPVDLCSFGCPDATQAGTCHASRFPDGRQGGL